MQAQVINSGRRTAGHRATALLIVGILLLLLGLVGLFSLQGKAVRFDRAYDTSADLSPYFFSPLQDGQHYSLLQNLWLGLVRYRLWVIACGVLLAAGFVLANK